MYQCHGSYGVYSGAPSCPTKLTKPMEIASSWWFQTPPRMNPEHSSYLGCFPKTKMDNKPWFFGKEIVFSPAFWI